LRQEGPRNIYCFYFDQLIPPVNWPIPLLWQPIRILTVPGIPSRFQSNVNRANLHTVCVAYVPDVVVPLHPDTAWDLVRPALFQQSPPLQRLQNWVCGPRAANKCKSGARTLVPEAHVTYVFVAGGIMAYDRELIRPIHRQIFATDPSLPDHLNDEMVLNRFH
jgi:hypothetical protein